MSVQVGPVQANQPDTAAVLPASTTAVVLLQDRQTAAAAAAAAAAAEAGAKQDTDAIPQALNVCCNGNYGIYLLARRGVQCMCAQCQSDRAAQPSGGWIMSPTEFERHSGMPTAKKWRMSIKVAHVGEPELPLGRWLELKGISQQRGMRVSTSPEHSHEPQQKQQAQQLQKPKQQPASAADGRDTHDAVRPCASSLARVLLQGLGRDQSGQLQGGSRPSTPQRTSSSTLLPQESHGLSEEPPHCSTGNNARQAVPFDVAAQLRICFPSQQAGAAAAAAATAAKMEAARVAAYAAAAAEAEAAAANAEWQVCTQQQRRQQHLPPDQGSNETSPTGGRSSSSSQGGQLRPSPPMLLEIPCPADQPPQPDEPAPPAAVLYNGMDPVPLEEAAAAAARGDDSLWLRSPMRRTPCSARQGPPGASRMINQEAVAAEAFRRLISAHLHPKPAGPASQQAGHNSSSGLGNAAAAAAAMLAGSMPANAAGRGSDGSSSDAACNAAGSMDSLAAAAAAVAAADAAEQAGDGGAAEGDDEGEEVEGGICVGPEHQADLPHVRPVPAFAAAVALMELKKSGCRGPTPEEALRMALEEKARSDLLPRDAVEDVWERAASGLALKRAQRHRKPPGWQAGYVDPLKPLSAQQNPADNTPQGAAGGNDAGNEADGTKNRKRNPQFEEALLQSSKKLRCSSMGGNGALQLPQNGLQASRLGPAGLKGRRMSLDGTPLAACCSDPVCPGSAVHGAPRMPPNGFWAPPKQPVYTAPVGPELLSWVLMVPPAAATLVKPAWAAAAGPAAAGAAAAAGVAQPLPQTAAGQQQAVLQQQPAAADVAQQQPGDAGAGPVCGLATEGAQKQQQQQQETLAAPAAAPTAADGRSSMDVDKAEQGQPTSQEQQQHDTDMPDVPEEASGPGSTVPAAAASTAALAAMPAAPTPAAGGPQVLSSAAATAAAEAAPAPAALPAPVPVAAGRASCVECVPASGSAVEVRIVLDGCVFVGQLTEVSRLEMARSRVGAAVEPIKQAEVHRLPPPGTTCALCHAPEAPGAHMDQAKALRSSGLSNRGLGPLMPVCMPPAKQATSGSRGDQHTSGGPRADAAAAGAIPDAAPGAGAGDNISKGADPAAAEDNKAAAAAAGAAAEAAGQDQHAGSVLGGVGGPAAAAAPQAAAAGPAPAATSEVVWVHRQCALWSPEVYPDKAGVLMHLPGAIKRGRATRCGHCNQRGATLKCAERSCARHFHLACARVAGCTLIPEPYAVGCPAHEPRLPDPSAAAALTALPSHRPPQDQHQAAAAVLEHPQLPVLRCRTTRHRAVGDVGPSGMPLAGSRDREGGAFTPLFPAGGSPMHVDSCGLGAESDFTPRAGSEDRDLEVPVANGLLAGSKRSRGGQSRLRHQTNTDWADNRFTPRPESPAHPDDGTPTAAAAAAAAAAGRPFSSAKPTNSRGSRGAGGSARGSYGSTQLHDSRGRFMSHAAAQLLASGFTSTPTGSARHRSAMREALDAIDSRVATPAGSDGPGFSTPRGAATDADGAMSDVSSGAPAFLSEATLGGTTGQPGRAGRCAVCVVQRKGKCGTESAPKKCLRRQLQEQQQAERAKKAAPILSVAAAASAVAIAAAEAEALAAARNSPALKPKQEPMSAAAAAALAIVAAEAEALAAARNSPAVVVKPEPMDADRQLDAAAAPAAVGAVAGSPAQQALAAQDAAMQQQEQQEKAAPAGIPVSGAADAAAQHTAAASSGEQAADAAHDADQQQQQALVGVRQGETAGQHAPTAAAQQAGAESTKPCQQQCVEEPAALQAEAADVAAAEATAEQPLLQEAKHCSSALQQPQRGGEGPQQQQALAIQQQQQRPAALGPFQRLLMSDAASEQDAARQAHQQPASNAMGLQAGQPAALVQQPAAAFALQQQAQVLLPQHHTPAQQTGQQLLAAAAVQHHWPAAAAGPEQLQLLAEQQQQQQAVGPVPVAQAVFGGLAAAADGA